MNFDGVNQNVATFVVRLNGTIEDDINPKQNFVNNNNKKKTIKKSKSHFKQLTGTKSFTSMHRTGTLLKTCTLFTSWKFHAEKYVPILSSNLL